MSLEFYKILHITGMIAVFGAIFAILAISSSGSTLHKTSKRLYFAIHGIGLLIVLVGGFGMLARLGMIVTAEWPLWVWMKLAIWFILGGAIVLAKKKANIQGAMILFLLAVGMTAATLAIQKPF